MKRRLGTARLHYAALFAVLAVTCLAGTNRDAVQDDKLTNLLARTSKQTSAFLDQFSDAKCTE